MSAVTRIVLGFLLVVAAGFLLLLWQLTKRVERQYLEAAEEPMADSAHLFASVLEELLDENGKLDIEVLRRAFSAANERRFNAQIYSLTKTTINTNIYVTDARGIVVYDSRQGFAEGQDYSWRRDVGLALSGQYGARSSRTDDRNDQSSVMFVAAPIRHQDEIVGVVSVSKPQRSMFAFMDETRARIRWLGIVAFAAVAVGAILVSIVFSRPIRRLTEYARSITRGERAPAPALGPPDVKALGHAFEEMRDALENRSYVESYVQTLTHEMKGPVAAIRGAAELLREEMPAAQRERFLNNIDAESSRLQRIVERLLALAEIESRKFLEHPEPVALLDLAREVSEQLRSAVEARGIRIELIANGNPSVLGERFLLEVALTNLLQNAIDFSPADGRVRVDIACQEDAPHVEISVEDEGPGIPDYAIDRVFERFYSLRHPATGRKSSGLGLCFVREAATLHGGTVILCNRAEGPGAQAILTLPLGVAVLR